MIDESKTRTRRTPCGPGVCRFEPSPRGTHEICSKCGTRFPCLIRTCGHVDCHMERGDPPPPGVTYVE